MARHRKIRIVAISFFALILTLIAVGVMGTSPAPDPAKLTPAVVMVDTSNLPPDEAVAEIDAVWRLFDCDTGTAYTPSQTAQVTVSLAENKEISRIRTYGASSYQLTVYRDNAGQWESVPSLSGLDLSTLGSSWNDLKASESFFATHLLLEFMPLGNGVNGLPEIEIWSEEPGNIQGNSLHATLEGLTTPSEALDLLASGAGHITEFIGAPSELTVSEDTGMGTYATVNIPMTHNPALFKRAYIVYDGYNIIRPVAIGRRINNGSWSGGHAIAQPEGTTPSWASHIEEINPAWLVQGENRIEFRSPNGTAYVRGMRLIVETDSGWNTVSSVSDPVLYDGDTKTSFPVAASSSASEIQIAFERPVEPEMLRLHLRGPINTTAMLQYKNGDAWQDVQAGWHIDLAALQTGWNDVTIPAQVTTSVLRLVLSTSGLRIKPGVKFGEINELRLCASAVGSKPDNPLLIVSYPRDGEYFGRTAFIQGFAMPSKNASGAAASVTAEGKEATQTADGSFSLSLTKDETRFSFQNDDEAWDPVVRSAYGTQQAASIILELTKNTESLAALAPQKESRGDAPFADNRDKHSDKVAPGQAKKIQYQGVTLDIPAGAVDAETEITIIPLTEAEIARLNPGMINVTYPAAGYRFLPHGIKFKKAIKLSFGYNKAYFAAGQKDDEVNMHYYDEKHLRWKRLNRVKVDSAASVVTSETDHFTDIINTTLVVPEHPQTLSFNPNSVKNIKAANPSVKVDLIEPPQGNSTGTANLAHPIVIPGGRGNYTPEISITYSSNNANGWLGLGWDIPISKVQVDTRWGVPRYDTANETESYLIDGDSLSPYAPRPFATELLEARSTGDKVFYRRVEGDFHRIVRKGISPHENVPNNAYYWEVTDKNGTKFIYGMSSSARLSSYTYANNPLNKNIFQWNLEKVIDTNKNVTQFIYETDSGSNGEPFKQIYIKEIVYTGYETSPGSITPGKYKIIFHRTASRPDVIIDGKPGFQVLTRQRLDHVDVTYNDTIIRQYQFTYIPDAEAKAYHFGKSLLQRIAVKGVGGQAEFYGHEFSYERMQTASGGYQGFQPQVKEWTNASGGQRLTDSEDESRAVSLALDVALSTNYPTFGFQGNYGRGSSTTNGLFMDVNGDGLADRIRTGGSVELNELGADRYSGSFRGASFSGIGVLGSNKQDNFSIGGHIGYWIASANFAYSYNFVNGESLMSDIDGDGYVDLVELSGGMKVRKNDGTKFERIDWNGYGTGHVEFGNDEAANQIKGDFFLSDPVRKWIAPYKGEVRVTGTIQKLRAGGKDDPIDPNDPDGASASVLAYIYKNNDATPLWTAALPATDLSSDSHDLAISVSPGDRLYFRVNAVDDTEADDVSWQPQVQYEQVCLPQPDGNEQCVGVSADHITLLDYLGQGLLNFDSGSELRLSGYPYNTWNPGAKGRVKIIGNVIKQKTSDDVTFAIKHNNVVIWTESASADSEGVFEHEIVREVLPNDELTFDITADTTVDPALVAWKPEVKYEEYCIAQANTNPIEYSCGAVVCETDVDGNLICTIDVPDLPPGVELEEDDLNHSGQANYPLYYLTPTDPARFWVAPYDGKVRIRGDVIRYEKTEKFLAVARGVNRLLWKKWIPAGEPEPPANPDDPQEERFPHDFEVSVKAGDQIFLDLQSAEPIDATQLSWSPMITYSEYCTTDPVTGLENCRPVTGTANTYRYCDTFDDDSDGTIDRTVCYSTTCPADTGPESGECVHCETTTYANDPQNPVQTCEPVVCTNDPIAGVVNCVPLSLIYKARPANLRYLDARYYDTSRADAEAFAGGYRQWHYGDWNGNITWDEGKIKRTSEDDVPEENSFSGDDYKDLPSYFFVYAVPAWQGISGYQKPLWRGRGDKTYIGAEQLNPSRLGGNVTAIIAGTGVGTIQQSVSKNTAVGVGLGPAGVSFSNGDSKSNLDFIDMNGDRFPDQVSQGSVLFNNGVNGFAPQAYPFSVGTVRTIDNENVSYQLAYTLPQNKQNPKGVTVKVQSPGASLGLSYGVSDSSNDLMDINGDGLPDRVSRGGGGFLVSLNLGYRFSGTITWPSGGWGVGNISNDPKVDINADALQINENATYSLGASFWGIGGGASYTVARGIMALRDINGDGLADQILKRSDRSDNYFQVKLNRGNRFGDTEQWNAPAWGRAVEDDTIATWLPGENDTINYTATESYQLTAGVVIMIPLIPVLTVAWIDIAPTVSLSGGIGGASLDFQDINGDGFADHLLKLKGDTAVYARLNNVEQTNLLKEVKRPLGGKFTLEYELEGNTVDMPQSQWVMSKFLLSDGMGNTYDTRFEYGAGYFDRSEQEFYGFDRVLERHATGTSIERSIARTYFNRDYYLRNLLVKSVTRDKQGNVWDLTAHTYELTDVAAGSRFPKLKRRDTYFYEGTTASETGYKKKTYQAFTYDLYGNIASFFKEGDLNTAGDDVAATITYWRNPQEYIVAKPEEISVRDSDGRLLRRRWATYDHTTGNMLTLKGLLTANQNSTWRMTYDDFGNIRTITDPVGYVLTYAYDTEVATYITKIQDNFPSAAGGPYYSEASYDLRFGEVYESRDINGNYQVNGYDDFGRLNTVYGPYDTDAAGKPTGTPTIVFEYTPAVLSVNDTSITSPVRAITRNKAASRVGSNGNTLDTVIFVDGMNRMIQTKKESDVNGVYGMSVSGKIVYDDMGRIVEKGQPIFQNDGDLYAYLRLGTPLNPEKSIYDPLDRNIANMVPDSGAPGGYAVTTTIYSFGRVNNIGPTYFMNTVIDPEGNKSGGPNNSGVKVTYRDADDNIIALREYNKGTSILTTYAYDPLNQIGRIRDDDGNLTTVEYDLSGRRTAITNPDTGRTEYDYDANGNLISKLTANYQRGKEIKYEYVFNRLKKIDYPYSTDVLYEYGAMGAAENRAGRISKITDESGEEERFYGKLGEITKEIKRVNAKTPPVQRKKFTTEYVFDSFGRMLEMTYPDGEKLRYAYDNGGMLKAAWGEKNGNRYEYIKSLQFDEFGQRRSITYGNGVTTYYTNDSKTRRLRSLITKLKKGQTIQNLSYEYDLIGNVVLMKNDISTPTNTALPAGPIQQDFLYDDLYRLTLAKGAYSFGPGKQNTYRNEFTYDAIGNMLRKVQEHKIIQPSLSVHEPKETNYVLQYLYDRSNKPHAVRSAGDKSYTYDPAGNMTSWTHQKNGTRRVITWSEENRVKQIDDNGKSTYFLYDDGGERVIKRGQHGETIYVNRFYSIRNGELGTKQVFAGETRVLSKLVKTPNSVNANTATTSNSSMTPTSTTATIPGEQGLDHGRGKKLGIIRRLPDGYTPGVIQPVEKDQFYYHGDHLGSSNMITDTYSAVYQHLEYFPFGETWIEEGGSYGGNTPGYKFTGKELDPETGLYYYGVRYYDPVLSKWISADPAMGKYLPVDKQEVNQTLPGLGGVYNPANLGLYSYSHLNPVRFTDPDGEDVLVPVSSRWSNKDDISHLKRYKKNPYLIYKFEVYDYDTIQAYEAAEKSGTLTKPIGSTELSFEARMVPKEGEVNRGTILGDESKWAQIQNVQEDYGWDTNHAISVTDIGKGKKDIFTTAKKSSILTKFLNLLGFGKTETEGTVRKHIRLHRGGPSASLGCGTSPDPKFKTKKSFEQELTKQAPSIGNKKEQTFILLPARREVEQ